MMLFKGKKKKKKKKERADVNTVHEKIIFSAQQTSKPGGKRDKSGNMNLFYAAVNLNVFLLLLLGHGLESLSLPSPTERFSIIYYSRAIKSDPLFFI